MKNISLIYDGSFKGFLSCVFITYEQKLKIAAITPAGEDQPQLFAESLEVITEEKKAQRVWKAIQAKMSRQGQTKVKWAFLSEESGIELKLLEMFRYVFSERKKVDTDYSNPTVLHISNVAKQVAREKHRMEAFVRFRLTRDDLYFAIIEPDFNVLPIIAPHFKSRYADQKWLIYDIQRKFGIHYDLQQVSYVTMELPADIGISGANPEYFDESEIYFQHLWKQYFDSTNIKSRVNMGLHIKHVPKRYWKYLSEKSPFA